LRITGQQLLGGMGELHLQIVAERLRREFNVELYTGAVQVAYREGVREATSHESRHAATPGGAKDIEVVLAIKPADGLAWATTRDAALGDGGGHGNVGDGEGQMAFRCGAAAIVRERLTRRELSAALEGLEAAAQHGQRHGFPLYGVRATILSVCKSKAASPDALRKACAEALPSAVEQAAPVLLEPCRQVRETSGVVAYAAFVSPHCCPLDKHLSRSPQPLRPTNTVLTPLPVGAGRA
jgi:elongation factor G